MNLFIKKRKTNNGFSESLWVDFTYNNKRHRKSLGLKNTPSNRRLAKEKLIPQMQINLINGEFFDKSKMPTVNEYMTLFFELKSASWTDSTKYGHSKNYDKYIEPIFGNVKVDTLTSRKITLWQNNLIKKYGLAKATIDKIRGLLYGMYEDIIEKGILNRNPVSTVKKISNNLKPKREKRHMNPFSTNEIQQILSVENGQTRNLYALLFFTGVRIGEAIGLKWSNVDFDKGVIKIVQQIRFGEERELKTQSSIREIPIIKTLLPFLKNQYELNGKYKSFVFLNTHGKSFYHSNKISEQFWKKTFKKIDIPYRNLHQTRHTFISNLISSGEDINYVSKIAGHINTRVTLEKYSTYIPYNKEDFGKVFRLAVG